MCNWRRSSPLRQLSGGQFGWHESELAVRKCDGIVNVQKPKSWMAREIMSGNRGTGGPYATST